jgi:uncharacterized protein (DUF2141 family)
MLFFPTLFYRLLCVYNFNGGRLGMKLKGLYLLMCLAFCPTMVIAETLVINFSGVQVGKGNIRAAVFDSADEFPSGKYIKSISVAGDAETIRIEVSNLVPGQYAISAFQDLNGNDKIDKNIFGIPKEPYGFSGKWKSGAASFDEALFQLKPEGAEISIKMK